MNGSRARRGERRLRVWSIGDERAGRRVVAAKTQITAAKLLGVAVRSLRQFGRETVKTEEIFVAMQEPGAVFATKGTFGGRRDEGPFERES